MKLTEFQIKNFRSLNDSGPVAVRKLTSLVGRNESGKTNLLLALTTLKPPGGQIALNPIKDFPRHRRLSECTDDTEVVSTTWELSDDEEAELTAIFPPALGVTHIRIGRRYTAPSTWVRFVDLKPLAFSAADVEKHLRKIQPVLEAPAEKLEADPQAAAKAAISKLVTDLTSSNEPLAWAQASGPSLANLRKVFAGAGITILDREDGLLEELEDTAAKISGDGPACKKTRDWATALLPTFVYVSEYPELTGHKNIDEYLTRKQQQRTGINDADRNFEKMCEVAGLGKLISGFVIARNAQIAVIAGRSTERVEPTLCRPS
jgi:AAA ATPase domain